MTRESKLALIIGFVLILVVGVLVSDHLSQAASDTIDPNSGLDEPALPIAHLPSEETRRSTLDTKITQASPERREFAESKSNPLYNARTDDPIVISQAPREPSLFDQMRDSVKSFSESDTPVLAAQARHPLPSSSTRSYTVEEGDSLYAIARRLLKSGDRWAEIHQLNLKLLGPDPVLQPGMVLKIPGNAIVTPPNARQSATRTDSSDRSEPTTRSRDVRSYTVVSGDSLSMIAQRLLGTSKRTDELAEFNGLSDSDDIRIGMVLKIPAR